MSWRRFLRRENADAELQRELESYLEITTAEYIERGMEPDAARAAARRKLGNCALVREEVYRMNTLPFLESLSAASRYWFRTLRREPVFAAATVLTLALGIGATTAIFSIVNGILLKPLPYPSSAELVTIRHNTAGLNFGGRVGMSPSMLFTYRQENRVFQSIGGWLPDVATVTGFAEPERVVTLLVTFGMLQSLNVPPALGRWLSEEDDKPGSAQTLLLSYGYWQRRFGGDPTVIGRSITVDSRPRRIVGVMPRSFRFVHWNPEDLYIPLQLDPNELHLGDLSFQGIARLRPGLTVADANTDVARMVPMWLRSWPAPGGASKSIFENGRFEPVLRTLQEAVAGNVGRILWLILGCVGIVLMIACANVANLLLVKADSRQQERSIRVALGAGRSQILRDALAESLLLGVAGGLLGLAFASYGIRLLRHMAPGSLPRLDEVSIDAPVLLFALAVSFLACLLFGVMPAWKSAKLQLVPLGGGARSAGLTRQRHRVQNVLVVAQVSLAVVLLVTSGLMVRTFQEMRSIQPGFAQPEQVQVSRLLIPATQVPEPERVLRMHSDILKKLAAIPGVSVAGLANSLPMESVKNQNPMIPENPSGAAPDNPKIRTFKFVSPGFLQAMGTHLKAGRDLHWTDIHNRRPVVMVSENLAREVWGSSSAALGKRLRDIGSKAEWREIVGVVEDVRDDGAQHEPPATVYWPFAMVNFQRPNLNVQREPFFAIRSPRAGTESFAKEIRGAVASVNPMLPLARIRTLEEIYRGSMSQTSFTLVMLAIAGCIALVLGIVGVYGVIACTVARRRREVGIRMALGAEAATVRRMFLRHGLCLAGAGIAVGLIAAANLTSVMSALLFGVTPLDPLTYAATSAVLLAAAIVATYIPARRAAAVDPAETLRAE